MNEAAVAELVSGEDEQASVWPSRIRLFLMRNALPIGLVGLIAIMLLLGAPNFLTVDNFRDTLRLSAPVLVVAVPMAFLLIMGYVDLSVGSVAALAAVTMGLLISSAGWAPLPAVAAGLLVGVLVGVVNGALVTYTALAPVIVTLGTLTAVRGLAMLIAPAPVYGFGDDFSAMGYTGVLGVPYLVIAAIVVVAVGGTVLALTPTGRHVMAVGVNSAAAYLSGVRVSRVIFGGFVLTGLCAGLAGVMYGMLLNSAPSGTLGIGFELTVLTAVMLGGVAFNGGRGTIRGVVLGVIFLALLQNGLTLLNVQAAVSAVIQGLALVAAALLDRATVRADSGGRG